MIINTGFKVFKLIYNKNTMSNHKQTPYCCPHCGSTDFYGMAIEYYYSNPDTGAVLLESTDKPDEILCKECDEIMEEDIFDKMG